MKRRSGRRWVVTVVAAVAIGTLAAPTAAVASGSCGHAHHGCDIMEQQHNQVLV